MGTVGTVMVVVSMCFVRTLHGIDAKVIWRVSTYELDQNGLALQVLLGNEGLFGACGFWHLA